MYLALRRYSRPQSIDECMRLYHEPGERAALLSGGTDLNAGGHEALTHVVDLQALPLDVIHVEASEIRLGARVTLARLRHDPALADPWLGALREAAAAYAILALQNRSTLGGRVASDRSDLDLPPALAALGARVELVRPDGAREVIDYPLGAARAALAGALVTAVIVPRPRHGVSALRRFGRTAVDVPLATVAAARADGVVRIAANLQGPSAADMRRMTRAEAYIAAIGDSHPPATWRADVRAALTADAASWTDPWASGAYRNDLTATLGLRAVAAIFGEAEIV
jgi:xanthine dehydrogenase small subunit